MKNPSSDWYSRFQAEIEMAKAARREGKEGRARVCARRAAGIVIGEYFRRLGVVFHNTSAYERLKHLSSFPNLSPAVKTAIKHLLLRVDENFVLPEEVDLIADANILLEELSADF